MKRQKDEKERLLNEKTSWPQHRKDSKKSEPRQREIEEELKLKSFLLDNVTDSIIVHDIKGKILLVNRAASLTYGYTEEEFLAMSYIKLPSAEHAKLFKKRMQSLQKTGEMFFTSVHQKKQGAAFPIEGHTSVVEAGRKKLVLHVIRDITERKQAESARALIAAGIEEFSEIIALADKDMKIQYINAAVERITGYSQRQALGSLVTKIFPSKEMSLASAMQKACKHGEAWKGLVEVKKAGGSECRVEAAVTPVRDKDGSILNCVLVIRDVTQEEKIKERLIRSEKMEALGTLAGGIAHDFNNILSSILGYTELTVEDVPKGTLAFDNLKQVLQAGKRGKDLVKQILYFSRQEKPDRVPTQVKRVVEETANMLRASIPSTIKMRLNLQSEAVVMADETQLSQVLMNLCTNAVHAMTDRGGILEICLKDIELDEDFVQKHPDIRPGSYLKLGVSDTGHGIDPSGLGRIFDPFFTTKEKGLGTGMGLPVAHGIVKSLGGEITVYSKLGKGTTFNVFLPRSTAVSLPEIEGAAPVAGGEERILFVDDEAQIVDIGKQILERLGYQVFTRTSSIEALEAFRARPDKFDLVIADMTMPNMAGDRLAVEIRRIRPDIPIILCTGFSERITEESVRYITIQEILMKPLLRKDVAGAVRRVLDRAKTEE